uniref:Uncharacterized protein n=1 Tax=Odontella aurita TaxID=265563 RepID=A0A7S4HWK1_9STRA|mmetsp:Transcript_16332/g.47015  ORF Transcript_16332/g.47015 Transcript_16332/m.47015 type:complete len:106 (+) Transcript_16332:321-638(+)
MLCRLTGISKRVWPMSVHELRAAIFYALAQHQLLRGMDPEREHWIHSLRDEEDVIAEGDSDGNGNGNNDGGKETGKEAKERETTERTDEADTKGKYVLSCLQCQT